MRAYGLDNKKPGTSTTLLTDFKSSGIAEGAEKLRKDNKYQSLKSV